jgi:sulfur transfer complex TusBCD TusB component (DsrH family)
MTVDQDVMARMADQETTAKMVKMVKMVEMVEMAEMVWQA